MAIAALVDNPHGSQEMYEKVRDGVWSQMPDGALAHVAGPRPGGGWRVLTVWESQEQAQRFFEERLMPFFQESGLPAPPEPEFWPVYNFLT
jgi:hypothetical protein